LPKVNEVVVIPPLLDFGAEEVPFPTFAGVLVGTG
jgi:hypothetical protein